MNTIYIVQHFKFQCFFFLDKIKQIERNQSTQRFYLLESFE